MEKLPTYKFCSKEFYHHICNDDGGYNLIYNKYCNGYCKRICSELVWWNNIPLGEIFLFLFNHEIRKKHKCKMLFGLRCVPFDSILGSAFRLLKYNNLFKKIIKWSAGDYDVIVYTDFEKDIVNSESLWPMWLVIIYKYSPYLSRQYYNIDKVLYSGNNENISKSVIISILQRRSTKRYISKEGITQTKNIINIIHLTIKSFTTKNMCKLISYYI